jgi:hypothetical protein
MDDSLSARYARRESPGHAVLDALVNKGETAENLKDLGSQFKELPSGWKFRVKVLDRGLTVTPPAPGHLAWVTMDEFRNTYEGCGYDAACNYVP